MHHVVRPIRVVRHSRKHTNSTGIACRVASGVFERGPAFFEKDTLLWVHDLGLAWRNAEECGVEVGGLVEQPATRNVAAAAAQCFGVESAGAKLLIVQRADGFLGSEQVAPEFRNVICTGKTSGDSDDGDAFQWLFAAHRLILC